MTNPILSSALKVFLFWWAVLTAWGLWRLDVDETGLWTAITYSAMNLVVVGTAAFAGLVGTTLLLVVTRDARGRRVRMGDAAGGARASIGTLPRPPKVEAGRITDAELAAHIPQWPALKASHPAYAEAIRAVAQVMQSKPGLPASPVPGGHGGRTLIQHSAGVVEHILRIVGSKRGWVFEGQRNKKGQIVRANNDGPHRFTPDDLGLLMLTAFAHDIGKVACYEQRDGRVVEVLPNHDTEGARLLRLIPEVMALPLKDRRALITAIAYYHHPFSIPDTDWVDDRTRSLMELLIAADHACGRAEGHVLTNLGAEVDEDDYAPVTYAEVHREESAVHRAVQTRILQAEAGIGSSTLLETADAVDAATAEAEARQAAERAARAHESMEGEALADAGLEIRLLDRSLQKGRGQINHKDLNTRIGFKRGAWVFLAENRLRAALANLPPDDLQAAGADPMKLLSNPLDNGVRINPFTLRLLNALARKGWLLTKVEIEGKAVEVSPKNALWTLESVITSKGPMKRVGGAYVGILAEPFGLDRIKDWQDDIRIVQPFFGLHQAINKGRAADGASEPEPDDEIVPQGMAETPEDGAQDAPESHEDDKGAGLDPDRIAEKAQEADTGLLREAALQEIRESIDEAELEPTTRKEGFAYYKADGSAAGIITATLERYGLSKDEAGIKTKTGGSGAMYYLVPEVSRESQDQADE